MRPFPRGRTARRRPAARGGVPAGRWRIMHAMQSAAGDARAGRLARVRARMAALDIDALVVTHLPNVHYLTGMRASAAAAVIDGGGAAALIVDARYITAARELAEAAGGGLDLEIVEARKSCDQSVAEVLRRRGAARAGVESEHISLARWQWLVDALRGAVTLEPTRGLVEAERLIKDAAEADCLRRAGRMLAGVVPAALALVAAGRTEREVAADIERALAAAGFEDRAFETIVASGPRSALPHARPGGRRLAAGDLVVLDFGGVHDGYCVDLTRTASVGEPGEQAVRLHAAVLAAQTAAAAAVRPGARASAVDAAARGVLRGRGLAEAFQHGTGHGLGLEVHEAPRLADAARLQAPGADAVLQAGMVLTVEPGVYVPGAGGVRIEDDVLVTADGCEMLTEAPRALAVC